MNSWPGPMDLSKLVPPQPTTQELPNTVFALTQTAFHVLSSLPAEFYYLTSKTSTPGTFQTL